MTLTLVRHAEVLKEFRGKYNGHIDIALSQNGKAQAKELAQKLKETTFDKVYCSDLLRARETLAAFELKQKIFYTPRLREKSWGKHEGKSFVEIEAQGIKYKNFEQWINTLDGEEMSEYIERLREFFYEDIFKQEAQNILVVTHSGVIKTLLHLTKKITLEEAFSTTLPYSSHITLDTIHL